MLSALWRLFCNLLGRGYESPGGPRPKPEKPHPEKRGHGLSTQVEDNQDTDWVDRIERRTGGGGDWLQQRLRSLPDEQRGREPDKKGRSR